MKILRIGIAGYEEIKARTMAIARGELKPSPDEPKLWFTSIRGLIRVLSSKEKRRRLKQNREVLGIEDFTEADIEALQRAQPSPESAAFDHELTEDRQ